MEEWKDIEGQEGKYQVSSLGRVKSLPRKQKRVDGVIFTVKGCIRKERLDRQGRAMVNLRTSDGIKNVSLPRLVAKAFVPNPKEKPEVNHLDGNPLNNNRENLEWCTSSENKQHAFATGLNRGPRGERNGSAKLTAEQVCYIQGVRERGYEGFAKDYFVKLGERFSVSPRTIEKAWYGHTWGKVVLEGDEPPRLIG